MQRSTACVNPALLLRFENVVLVHASESIFCRHFRWECENVNLMFVIGWWPDMMAQRAPPSKRELLVANVVHLCRLEKQDMFNPSARWKGTPGVGRCIKRFNRMKNCQKSTKKWGHQQVIVWQHATGCVLLLHLSAAKHWENEIDICVLTTRGQLLRVMWNSS